jgi:hypothetical protein
MLALNPLASLALLGAGALAFAVTKDFFRSGLVAIGLAAPVLAIFGHDRATVALAALTSVLCLVVHHPIIDVPRQPRPG